MTVEATQDENFKGKLTPLEGNMPSEIGLLRSLERLIIVGMKVSGPILDFINGTEKLTVLDVHSNSFSGSIAESFSKEHPALSYLNLERNSFTGKIPNSIGNFASLTTFNAQANQIEGSLPSTLAAIPTLSTCFTTRLNVFGVLDHNVLTIFYFIFSTLECWRQSPYRKHPCRAIRPEIYFITCDKQFAGW